MTVEDSVRIERLNRATDDLNAALLQFVAALPAFGVTATVILEHEGDLERRLAYGRKDTHGWVLCVQTWREAALAEEVLLTNAPRRLRLLATAKLEDLLAELRRRTEEHAVTVEDATEHVRKITHTLKSRSG